MKTKLLIFVLLVGTSLAIVGSPAPKKDERKVTLSDVSSVLSPFEGNSNFDFVGDSILYKQLDKENYDKIFKESAIIYATTVQVHNTIEGINNGTIPTKSEFAIRSIAFAVKDLPQMQDRVNSLL